MATRSRLIGVSCDSSADVHGRPLRDDVQESAALPTELCRRTGNCIRRIVLHVSPRPRTSTGVVVKTVVKPQNCCQASRHPKGANCWCFRTLFPTPGT